MVQDLGCNGKKNMQAIISHWLVASTMPHYVIVSENMYVKFDTDHLKLHVVFLAV